MQAARPLEPWTSWLSKVLTHHTHMSLFFPFLRKRHSWPWIGSWQTEPSWRTLSPWLSAAKSFVEWHQSSDLPITPAGQKGTRSPASLYLWGRHRVQCLEPTTSRALTAETGQGVRPIQGSREQGPWLKAETQPALDHPPSGLPSYPWGCPPTWIISLHMRLP